jgi:hypothetical protein
MDKTTLRQTADRFESLGDNCEFGFVCRKLGVEEGSLFRWASMKPPALLALLFNDFRHIYDFERLAPLRANMVHEGIYGIGWQSKIRSSMQQGVWSFAEREALRRSIHAEEERKIRYLVEKFRERIAHGGVIYVIKENAGTAAPVIDAIHHQLSQLAAGAPFWLLHVMADETGAKAGQVEDLGHGRLRGHVRRFAPYDKADDLELDDWKRVIEGALALAPFAEWPATRRAVSEHLQQLYATLPFPAKSEVGGRSNLSEDFSHCSVTLANGHEWSRLLDDGTFRLHARGMADQATSLTWSRLEVRQDSTARFTLDPAVPDTEPVEVTLRVLDRQGHLAWERLCRVSGASSATIEVPLSSRMQGPVSIELRAVPVQELASGQRAVVDLAAPTLERAKAEPRKPGRAVSMPPRPHGKALPAGIPVL